MKQSVESNLYYCLARSSEHQAERYLSEMNAYVLVERTLSFLYYVLYDKPEILDGHLIHSAWPTLRGPWSQEQLEAFLTEVGFTISYGWKFPPLTARTTGSEVVHYQHA